LTRSGYTTAISAFVLLFAGALLGYPELAAVGLACVAALAMALVWRLLATDLAVSRTVEPRRVDEGASASSRLTVTNRRRRRVPQITGYEVVGGAKIPICLPGLSGGQSVTTIQALPTHRRGKHVLAPLTLGYSDPFRLIQGSISYGRATVLWVHPRRHYMTALPGGGARDSDGPALSRPSEGGVAFHSLREHQPGDDSRLIHWPSTARAEQLLVRQNALPDEGRHLVVLDTGSDAYDDEETFEDAIRVAASWCAAAVREGCQLRLCTTDGRNANGHLLGALDFLAEVTVSETDQGLAALASLVSNESVTAVGVVTGQGSTRLGVLPSIRSRVASLSLALVGGRRSSVQPPLPAVLSVSADTSEHLAAQWNELVK
jgi:uncharacterized protein (DUF58 family)